MYNRLALSMDKENFVAFAKKGYIVKNKLYLTDKALLQKKFQKWVDEELLKVKHLAYVIVTIAPFWKKHEKCHSHRLLFQRKEQFITSVYTVADILVLEKYRLSRETPSRTSHTILYEQ